MKLLAGKLYDPAVAVNKATTALLAMTALDTTNLRHVFTVPSHGMVLVKMRGCLHGATTVAQVLFGVLEGSTVKGRAPVMLGGGNIAATTRVKAEADFLVTGLTPDALLTWDAAYGVEVIVSSTGLKYGGPNNTTTNDAFGGFAFEIWDPAPAAGSGSGLDAAGVRDAVGLASANLDTQLGSIGAKTTNLPADPADASDLLALLTVLQADTDNLQSRLPGALVGGKMSAALDATERAAVVDKLLGRNIAGGSDTGRTVHEALAFLRNRWAIDGTTLTVYAADDATPLFIATITRAQADAITEMDPA